MGQITITAETGEPFAVMMAWSADDGVQRPLAVLGGEYASSLQTTCHNFDVVSLNKLDPVERERLVREFRDALDCVYLSGARIEAHHPDTIRLMEPAS